MRPGFTSAWWRRRAATALHPGRVPRSDLRTITRTPTRTTAPLTTRDAAHNRPRAARIEHTAAMRTRLHAAPFTPRTASAAYQE